MIKTKKQELLRFFTWLKWANYIPKHYTEEYMEKTINDYIKHYSENEKMVQLEVKA